MKVEELKLLLDKDTHALKMGNSDGQTALHLGAFEGHANVSPACDACIFEMHGNVECSSLSCGL